MTSEINARNWQNQVGIDNVNNQLSLLATQKDNVNNGPDRLALGTTLISGLTSAAGGAWGSYQKGLNKTPAPSSTIQLAIDTGNSVLKRYGK